VGIFSKFAKREKRDAGSQRADSLIAAHFFQGLIGSVSQAGIQVTPQKAMGVATVYACVNVLSRTISTLPLHVYRRSGDKNEKAYDQRVYDLLHNAPNSEMTSADFRAAVQGDLSLRNNGYAQIVRDRTGRIIELIPVRTEHMHVYRNLAGELRYRYSNGSQTIGLGANEVIHLKGHTRDGLLGEDLVRMCNDVIGLAIALDVNASKYFANGSRPGNIYEHPGVLTDKAFDRLKEDLKKKSGPGNEFQDMILEDGLKMAKARSENRDSQFDESRNRQSLAICSLFGVPPHKVGIVSNQPRANVEQENISFAVDTIRPLCVVWEQVLNQRLFTAEERRIYYAEFDISGLVRGDLKTRYEAYAQARQWGWLSVNEIRKKENMNPIGVGGDTYMQPLNMTGLGQQEEANNA